MKKVLATILSLAMVLSLAACGGGAAEEEAPKEEAPKQEEVQKEEPKVETVTMKFAGTAAADASNGEYQAMLMVEELVEK